MREYERFKRIENRIAELERRIQELTHRLEALEKSANSEKRNRAQVQPTFSEINVKRINVVDENGTFSQGAGLTKHESPCRTATEGTAYDLSSIHGITPGSNSSTKTVRYTAACQTNLRHRTYPPRCRFQRYG